PETAALFLCRVFCRGPDVEPTRGMAGWRYVLPVTRSSAAFVLSVIRLTVPDLEFLILSVFLHEILPA
ncbi:hypothetical protein, partial [Alistipes ihumii]|uniref:hypothetical protein n=1 Tax=Alistipes ihumii TaxID=1470347 RepID=UPI003AB517FA